MRNAGFIFFIFLPVLAFGHGKEKHGEAKAVPAVTVEPSVMEKLTVNYDKTVQPIFQKKCFDCHSTQTIYPWYYKVPGVGALMNSHIKEARSHIDMTKGFPFKGHGGPEKDLKEIISVVKKDKMPPWYYTPFHKNSKLTEEEKKEILAWANDSLKLMDEQKRLK